jgi:DNA polymerase alpha-associated DNA helicase A
MYAMRFVQGAFKDGKESRLMQVLFGISSPMIDTLPDLIFSDDSLNDSQKEAIRFCVASRDVGLIHGPPGTGKTTTVAELIRQLAKKGEKILVCGPSNISVDNLVEKLAHSKLNITRIGHPARLLPSVLAHALDIRIKSSDEGALVNDVRKEIDQALSQANKCKSKQERRGIYQDVKHLRKELKVREKKVVSTMLQSSKVVLSTLNGAASSMLRGMEFDTVIIDEVTQALEPETWIAIPKGKKLVIAGDPLQLPPTVKSKPAIATGREKPEAKSDSKRAGTVEATPKLDKLESEKQKTEKSLKEADLEFTLFDRLTAIHGSKIKKLLNVQYRMHEDIMSFSNKLLYEGKLEAHESVKAHLLNQLSGVEDTDETSVPVIFIDTAGNAMHESQDADFGKFAGLSVLESASRFNEGELDIVENVLEKLIKAKVSPNVIGIISPYNAQVERLATLLGDRWPDLEISSVDGFQGREKEAIIISLVRSNDTGQVGFLSEKRRLNVAITRPRRLLVVVGDSETLSQNVFLNKLCEYLTDVGELRFP